MLRTACILTPRQAVDGYRISVMSRHTLNDGQTPDTRITPDQFDEHCPVIAPPAFLVAQWYRHEINWAAFTENYHRYLSTSGHTLKWINDLPALLSQYGTVTLLCIEPTPEHCHRRLLAEHCQLRYPLIPVEIF